MSSIVVTHSLGPMQVNIRVEHLSRTFRVPEHLGTPMTTIVTRFPNAFNELNSLEPITNFQIKIT